MTALALAVVAGFGFVFAGLLHARRVGELLNPLTIFVGLSLLDVFLPAIVFVTTGMPALPGWMTPLSEPGIALALLVFSLGFLAFVLGFLAIPDKASRNSALYAWDRVANGRVSIPAAYTSLIFFGGWYAVAFYHRVEQNGGVSAFLSDRLSNRFRSEAVITQNAADFFLVRISDVSLALVLIVSGVLFLYRYKYERVRLWGLVLPFACWLLTLTTLYRGSQLRFFLALAVLESVRMKVAQRRAEMGPRRPPVLAGGSNRSMAIAVVIGVLFFSLYGALRDYQEGGVAGRPVAASQALIDQGGNFTRGWGLISVQGIVVNYPDVVAPLHGTSIGAALLLPVPRFLWPSKPDWYGIDDVTRGMGWAPTTQNAVTMPGELYANFGWLGLPFVGGFGALFGLLFRWRTHPRMLFVYAMIAVPSALVTQWMSTTGLMNELIIVPPALFVLAFVIRTRQLCTLSRAAGGAISTPRAGSSGSVVREGAVAG